MDYMTDDSNLIDALEEPEVKDQMDLIDKEIATTVQSRAQNAQNHTRWFKKRFGIRPSIVVYPWRNASNLHIPLTDKTIRTVKPNFTSLISLRPTFVLKSNFTQDGLQLVKGIERTFDELLHDKMNIFPDMVLATDMMLEKGRSIVKTIQEFTPIENIEHIVVSKLPQDLKDFVMSPDTTDELLIVNLALRYGMDIRNEDDVKQLRSVVKQFRSGKDAIEFKRTINITPFPSIFVKDPLSVMFPNDTTFRIDQARWIEDTIDLTEREIISRAESGRWDKTNTNEILDRLKTDDQFKAKQDETQVDQLEEMREGVATGTHSNFYVTERYLWLKLPGKTVPERFVKTVHPKYPDKPLRLIRYPYFKPDGTQDTWCFDQMQFEIVNERALSPRGIPQLLDSLQTEMTNNHNAKQNWMTIANNLNLKVKRNAQVGTNWIPGQPLYVNRMDDVDTLEFAQRDLSFDNEERILKQWADEYMGRILDVAVGNQTNVPDRRTKAEIETLSALQAQVANLDVQVFQDCFRRVATKIWNRWMQFGPDQIVFSDTQGQPTSISKDEIKSRFQIIPHGNINNSNRDFVAQRAQQVGMMLGSMPFFNTFAWAKDFLTLVDERWSQTWLTEPQQMNQNEVERQITEIRNIATGYNVVPQPNDNDQTHIAVIDDFLKDPVKSRTFPPDRLIQLKNHRDAHLLAIQKKSEASTKGGRAMQEIANVAIGLEGRAARNPIGAATNGQ